MIKIKFIQNLSIKNKIVAIILLVSFLIHSIAFTFITIWDINRLKAKIQSNLTINTKLVGDNCIVPLIFDDKQQAAKALSRFRYIEFIEIACIHDREGNLFASYPAKLNHDSLITHNQHYNNIRKDGYFYVKEPVIFKDEIYGTIYLKANSKPLKTAKRNIIITLILLSIVLDVLVIILASRMQRYISLPIMKLKKHFDEIAESHDFSVKLTKLSNDEIGSLYDGFNNLLNRIKKGQQERDMAEEALRESEAKYRRVSDNSPAVLYQFKMTPEGEFSFPYVSDMVQSIMGISPNEVMMDPSKLLGMVHSEDLEMFNKSIMESAESLESFPLIFRCLKNGEVIWIETRGTPTPLTEGGVLYDGFLLDITERKLAEEELKKHKENLEKLVKERTKKLEEKNKELENMNTVFVGREFRIKELKDKLKKQEEN